jgi:hypothetical protein
VIAAWLLAEPRWIREDSRQTVVAVLDSSVSMSAFKAETRSLLQRHLAHWAGAAAHTAHVLSRTLLIERMAAPLFFTFDDESIACATAARSAYARRVRDRRAPDGLRGRRRSAPLTRRTLDARPIVPRRPSASRALLACRMLISVSSRRCAPIRTRSTDAIER